MNNKGLEIKAPCQWYSALFIQSYKLDVVLKKNKLVLNSYVVYYLILG